MRPLPIPRPVATALGLLLGVATAPAPLSAQIHSPQIHHEKKQREDVEWLWQYSPSKDAPSGRQSDLLRDPRFRTFLQQHLTAPQSFWGPDNMKQRRSLADTALDFLSVPGKVLADEDRFVSISGCVPRFCPSRGLLWVDLNGDHPLVVFGAMDWIKDSHTTDQPDAEYTLWLFSNHALSPESTAHESRIPPALLRSLTRWAADPIPGTSLVQHITTTILVDPDGTPHTIPNPG